MNTMAGSRPCRSSRSSTSTRLGIQTRRPLPTCWDREWPRLPAFAFGARRSRMRVAAKSSRATFRSSLLTCAPSAAKPGPRLVVTEQVEQPAADHHMLEQRNGPLLLEDHGRVATHRLQPLTELLGVRDRGGQRDQGDGFRQVNDDFFPDRTPHPVGEVMHLIHDDEPEADQRPGAGVQHVAEHLGRHDDDGCFPVDGVCRRSAARPDPLRNAPRGRCTSGSTVP